MTPSPDRSPKLSPVEQAKNASRQLRGAIDTTLRDGEQTPEEGASLVQRLKQRTATADGRRTG